MNKFQHYLDRLSAGLKRPAAPAVAPVDQLPGKARSNYELKILRRARVRKALKGPRKRRTYNGTPRQYVRCKRLAVAAHMSWPRAATIAWLLALHRLGGVALMRDVRREAGLTDKAARDVSPRCPGLWRQDVRGNVNNPQPWRLTHEGWRLAEMLR